MTTDPLDVAAGDDHPQPILLGEAPSKGGDRFHEFPLSGRPAKVLCDLAGIPPQPEGTQYGKWTWALYERFDCRNLIARYADATPWRAATARDRATAILADLERCPLDSDWCDGAICVDRGVYCPKKTPPVIVCLGRKVQAAVFAALDGDIRKPIAVPGMWGGGLFGNFGVWAAPWQIHTPVVRQVCRHCDEPRAFHESQCLVGVHGHEYEDRREARWAPHVVTIPHPSGLNRLLNDEATRGQCGEVLRRALELAGDDGTVPA
jgi:hypothetical protein